MSIDQQIQNFENKILQLEQLKRSYHLRTSGWDNDNESLAAGGQQIDEIERNLDESYREITILKIRRMMGF